MDGELSQQQISMVSSPFEVVLEQEARAATRVSPQERWAPMVQCGERYWLSSLLDYYKMGIPLTDRSDEPIEAMGRPTRQADVLQEELQGDRSCRSGNGRAYDCGSTPEQDETRSDDFW